MQEMILILDFGSQVTQLIGRRLRELNVYCEIHPFNKIPTIGSNVKGVILSGSPFSSTTDPLTGPWSAWAAPGAEISFAKVCTGLERRMAAAIKPPRKGMHLLALDFSMCVLVRFWLNL